jgi:hypothetical protein
LVIIYLPAETIAAIVRNDSTFALLLAVDFRIFAYVNGYAAFPLVSGL